MLIKGSTKIYAVTGKPVVHSLSPAIHNFLFQRFQIDAVYLALPVEPQDFSTLVRGLGKTSVYGLNITTPHKVRAKKNLQVLGPTAKAVGAANTLVRRKDGWKGINTDGKGFCHWLEDEVGFSLQGKKVVVLGAGPAARAVLFELHKRKVHTLTVINRSASKFRKTFFKQLSKRGINLLCSDDKKVKSYLSEAELIINGTSWGLGGSTKAAPPWQLAKLSPSLVVDLNYCAGSDTPFQKLFPKKVQSFDGQGMLRWQATFAFTAWTGRKLADKDHRALKQHLAKLDRP